VRRRRPRLCPALERPHIQKRKWFAFGFNGQLANYPELRAKILADDDNHLARDNDTEVLMHAIGKELAGDADPDPIDMLAAISKRFDGAWNIAMLDACGRMIVARDPLGIRPMEYARVGPLIAAASESVALLNLGFPGRVDPSARARHGHDHRRRAGAGRAVCRQPQAGPLLLRMDRFANVASTMDDRSVYLTRKRLGEELARLETIPIDADTVVVPVPDTEQGGGRRHGLPSVDPVGRRADPQSVHGPRRSSTAPSSRRQKAESKYTPLREVLEGKRVILVEDSIVRSTTMKVLLGPDAVAGAGAGDPRADRLPADRRPLLLRHRHVHDRGALRRRRFCRMAC